MEQIVKDTNMFYFCQYRTLALIHFMKEFIRLSEELFLMYKLV